MRIHRHTRTKPHTRPTHRRTTNAPIEQVLALVDVDKREVEHLVGRPSFHDIAAGYDTRLLEVGRGHFELDFSAVFGDSGEVVVEDDLVCLCGAESGGGGDVAA